MITIKTTEQINKIRQSCKLAAATLEHVRPLIVPGVTTNVVNKAAADFMQSNGAISATLGYKGHQEHAFPKETCVSVNEVICHGIASEQVLKEGDIVKVDVTTILDGYFGDTCKTFPVGKVTRKTKELMDCGEDCLRIGINSVRPGRPLGEIGAAIERCANSYGHTIIKSFCGHGCGIQFHEEPNVFHFNTKAPSPIMRTGMIFTIEPMLWQGKHNNYGHDIVIEDDHWTARTIDGKISVQNEHTVLVTHDGVEILTVI